MRKRWWTLAAVLLVIAAAVGVTMYLRRPKKAPPSVDEARPTLAALDREALVKVVLGDRAEGILVLEKSAPQTNAPSAPQTNAPSAPSWWASDSPAAPLDGSRLDELLSSFSDLTAERTIDENPTDLGQYGLAPARARVEGSLSDGTAKVFFLGDLAPTGNSYYLRVEGDPKVYTIWRSIGERFHWTLKDLRDRTIAPAINPDEITYLRLARADGSVIEITEKSTIESASAQFGFSRFVMTRPYRHPRGVDAEKQDAFLRGPLGIAIADFVDDAPKDLAAYGLAKPWGQVLVRDKTNTLSFQLGAKRKDGMTYFRVGGKPNVYAVQTESLSFMSTPAFDLVDKFAFIPNIDDVDRLEITTGGATHALTLARTKPATNGQGAEAEEVVTTYRADGKDVEEASFKKLYQEVIGLLVEGEVRSPPSGKPEVRTRYLLNKGAVRDVTVSYVPYDRDFYAVFVGGQCDFAISKGQVSAMGNALARLLAGEKLAD
jgi:hypothetical protein